MDAVKKDTSINYTITKMISCLIIISVIFAVRYYSIETYNFISNWYKNVILYESINVESVKESIHTLLSLSLESFKTCIVDILRSVTS